MYNRDSPNMQQVNSVDLKIVFSDDAKEWDKYLTDCLTEAIESASYQLQIVHERIENVQLGKFVQDEIEQLTKASSATLIILSPDFLAYVQQQNDDLRNYFKQFEAQRTLLMLCGVKEGELNNKIKENLVQFANCKRLTAKEQDNEFIYRVIDQIRSIFQANNKSPLDEIYSPYHFASLRNKRSIPNYTNEYQNLNSVNVTDDDRVEQRSAGNKTGAKFCKFRLIPSTIRKGNNKIFILLDQPLKARQSVKVTLEFKTPSKSSAKCKQELREIDARKRNPYTLQLNVVADHLLTDAQVIRVNLFLEQENGQTRQMGVRLLKTEKNETIIEHLSLSNCISLLRQSLALSSMDELDRELARRFRRTVPIDNLNKLLVEENLVTERISRKPVIEDLLTGDSTDQLLNLPQPISQRNSLVFSGQSDKSEPEKTGKVNNTMKSSLHNSSNRNNKFTEHKYPTLLHFAVEFDLKNFASSLLEFEPIARISCSVKNCHGLTPLSLAKLNGNTEISDLIKKYTKVDHEDQIIDLSETEPDVERGLAAGDLNYVNMSTIRLPDKEPTSDFTTDSSDQGSVDDVDSIGLTVKQNKQLKARIVSNYDFIDRNQPIKLGQLIDLDSLSTSEETSSDDLQQATPQKSETTYNLTMPSNQLSRENFDYDIVKASPRRADLGDSPANNKNLSSSFSSGREKCKANLFQRFDGLRASSSSSSPSQENEAKSIDLETTILTESQIELLNIIKAFKMGCYTNDEMEIKFKEWAAKHKCKIDQNNRFATERSNSRMGKRSVSSSHLLSQEAKLESKDSGCSSRSSTIKTCLSNINLYTAVTGSPSKYAGKQFSLTDWFHTLTAKLKQKSDKNESTRKSPKFENAKFEKKEKNVSPSKGSNWTKRLSPSNVLAVRRSLFETKDFEKLQVSSKSNVEHQSISMQSSKSMTLPLRNVSSNKSPSQTTKFRHKLNFKRTISRNGGQLIERLPQCSRGGQMEKKLINRQIEQFSDKLISKLSS